MRPCPTCAAPLDCINSRFAPTRGHAWLISRRYKCRGRIVHRFSTKEVLVGSMKKALLDMMGTLVEKIRTNQRLP